MKKVLIIFMALATFAVNAQNKGAERKEHRKEMKEKFTPEQKAELRTKKMALALDLNESQANKVKQLFLDMDKNKPVRPENRKEMTDLQKFEAKSAMLDRKISFKKQMKEILTEEQLAKWERGKGRKRGDSSAKRNSERKNRH